MNLNYKLFGSYIVPEVNSLKNLDQLLKKFLKFQKKAIICCDYGHNFLTDKINSIKK